VLKRAKSVPHITQEVVVSCTPAAQQHLLPTVCLSTNLCLTFAFAICFREFPPCRTVHTGYRRTRRWPHTRSSVEESASIPRHKLAAGFGSMLFSRLFRSGLTFLPVRTEIAKRRQGKIIHRGSLRTSLCFYPGHDPNRLVNCIDDTIPQYPILREGGGTVRFRYVGRGARYARQGRSGPHELSKLNPTPERSISVDHCFWDPVPRCCWYWIRDEYSPLPFASATWKRIVESFAVRPVT